MHLQSYLPLVYFGLGGTVLDMLNGEASREFSLLSQLMALVSANNEIVLSDWVDFLLQVTWSVTNSVRSLQHTRRLCRKGSQLTDSSIWQFWACTCTSKGKWP